MVEQRLVDEAVAHASATLRIGGRYRRRVVDELTDHVTATTEKLVTGGYSDDEALRVAIERLGPPEVLATQFAPRPGPWARWAGVSFFAGIGICWGALRAVNRLHQDGGRLGHDLAYSAAWLLGWLGIVALAAPVVAVIIRYASRITPPIAMGILALVSAAAFGTLFNLRSDGTITAGPGTNTWRVAMIGSILVGAITLLAITVHRGGLDPKPIAGAAFGTALIAVHYTVHYEAGDHHGPLAVLGLAIITISVVAIAVNLTRERSLR